MPQKGETSGKMKAQGGRSRGSTKYRMQAAQQQAAAEAEAQQQAQGQEAAQQEAEQGEDNVRGLWKSRVLASYKGKSPKESQTLLAHVPTGKGALEVGSHYKAVNIQEVMIATVDKMFDLFQNNAYEFNRRVAAGTELECNWIRPFVSKEVTNSWHQQENVVHIFSGRVSTRRWTMVVKGTVEEVHVFILPADRLIGFALSSKQYKPYFTMVPHSRELDVVWKCEDRPLSQDWFPIICKDLFEALIRFARDEARVDERFSLRALGLIEYEDEEGGSEETQAEKNYQELFFEDMRSRQDSPKADPAEWKFSNKQQLMDQTAPFHSDAYQQQPMQQQPMQQQQQPMQQPMQPMQQQPMPMQQQPMPMQQQPMPMQQQPMPMQQQPMPMQPMQQGMQQPMQPMQNLAYQQQSGAQPIIQPTLEQSLTEQLQAAVGPNIMAQQSPQQGASMAPMAAAPNSVAYKLPALQPGGVQPMAQQQQSGAHAPVPQPQQIPPQQPYQPVVGQPNMAPANLAQQQQTGGQPQLGQPQPAAPPPQQQAAPAAPVPQPEPKTAPSADGKTQSAFAQLQQNRLQAANAPNTVAGKPHSFPEALSVLLSSLDRELELVAKAGSDAFNQRDLARADAALKFSARLSDFRDMAREILDYYRIKPNR